MKHPVQSYIDLPSEANAQGACDSDLQADKTLWRALERAAIKLCLHQHEIDRTRSHAMDNSNYHRYPGLMRR